MNNTVLGKFNAFDDIFIDFYLNNAIGTGYPTLVHESCHKFLTFSTYIGYLEYFLFIELYFSKDERHNDYISNLLEVIYEFTTDIHEIYANNIELLTVTEKFGKDYSKEIYERFKTNKYKEYYDKLNKINQDPTIEDKKKINIITQICVDTLNVDICNEIFMEALETPRELENYFKDTINFKESLEKNIVKYLKEKSLEKDPYIETQGLINFIQLLLEKTQIIKASRFYINEFIKEFTESKVNSIMKEIKSGQIDVNFEFHKKIKTYSFKNITYNFVSNDEFSKKVFGTFVVFKNYVIGQRRYSSAESQDYLLIGLRDKHNLISTIGKADLINKILKESSVFNYCIVDYEYSLDDRQHYTLQSSIETIEIGPNMKKRMYVLINDYNLCCDIIDSIKNGAKLKYLNLSNKDNTSVFSTLIFIDFNNPNIIFFYPTTKQISARIIEKMENLQKVEYVRAGRSVDEVIGNTIGAVDFNSIHALIELFQKYKL